MKNRFAALRRRMEARPILTCFVGSLLINLLIELLSKRSLVRLVVFLGTRPHIFLFNSVIIFWSFSFLLLTKRRYFLGVVISIFWLLLGIVNFVLLSVRVTPFNWSDLRLSKDAIAIAGKYLTVWHGVLIAAGLIAVLVLDVILFLKLPKYKGKLQIGKGISTVLFSFFTLIGVCSAGMHLGALPSQFGNLAQAYQDNGFAFCFGNSVLNRGISKPGSYSTDTVKEIADQEIVPEATVTAPLVLEKQPEVVEQDGIAVTEKTPNVIFLQLESFSDPYLFKDIHCSEDPIPNFRRLREEYSGGFISVPAVGAGTANTEFEIITGMNLDFFGPGEYPYKTVLQENVCESICFDFKDLGYHAHAIHNNSGTFYDRYRVFSQLGFDTFTSLEYMPDSPKTATGWRKDAMLTEEIKKVLQSTAGADLIYTISVQGHGAYPTEKVIEHTDITVTGPQTEEEQNQMEYYIQQIHEMDAFVGDLISFLSNQKQKTVLVIYGDHLPSLNLTEDNLETGDVFQSEYVIWDNLGLTKKTEDLEAYQLGAYVAGRIGIQKGTMIRFHQRWLNKRSEDKTEETMTQYLDDMKVLEYDLLYGDQEIFDGKMPYEASKLHMGVQPITISNVLIQDDGMYVTGWYFTENSHIFLNGEEIQTDFVSGHLLYGSEFELQDGKNEVIISQISEDNVVLSSTAIFLLSDEKKGKE